MVREGARVGTSALRTRGQRLAVLQYLAYVELRRNSDTRLRKQAAGRVAGWVAERAAVRELGASSHTPVGVYARFDADGLRVSGFVGLPDGSAGLGDEVVGAAETAGAAEAAGAGEGAEAAGAELARR